MNSLDARLKKLETRRGGMHYIVYEPDCGETEISARKQYEKKIGRKLNDRDRITIITLVEIPATKIGNQQD